MKKKIIIIVCLVLVTFGGTVYYCIGLMNNKKENPVNDSLNSEEIPEANDDIVDEKESSANEEGEPDEVENESNSEDKTESNNSKDTATNTGSNAKPNSDSTSGNSSSSGGSQNNSNSSSNSSSGSSNGSGSSLNSSSGSTSGSNNTSSGSNKKTVVNTSTSEETEVESEKYGTKIMVVRKYTVTTYSDGSTEKKLTSTSNRLDTSGYSATTNDLKAEATSLVDTNWNEYTSVLNKVNEYRSEVGEAPLTLDRDLCIAATIRSMENAYKNIFSHTRPNGSDCSTIMRELGISWGAFGENITAGQSTGAAAANSWRNSQPHYENMISNKFSKIGVGMAKVAGSSYTIYWTQIFKN